jgi:hypothetical protein
MQTELAQLSMLSLLLAEVHRKEAEWLLTLVVLAVGVARGCLRADPVVPETHQQPRLLRGTTVVTALHLAMEHTLPLAAVVQGLQVTSLAGPLQATAVSALSG